MGLGSNCTPDLVTIANKYLGTSYDTIVAVFEHLDKISLVAENLELEKGIQGNTPSITQNPDGTVTIHGYNGDATVSRGEKGETGEMPTVRDNGSTITITDGDGTSVTFDKGFNPVKGVDYVDGVTPVLGVDYTNGIDGSHVSYIFTNSSVAPTQPTGGSYDGDTELYPSLWTDDPQPATGGQHTWVSKTRYSHDGSVYTNNGWSAPIRYTGLDGNTPEKGVDYFDGEEGSFTSFIFRNSTDSPDEPVGGSYNGVEVIPVDWSDDATTAPADEFTWVCITKYFFNTISGDWENNGWTAPAKFSGETGYTPQKGVDYVDGDDGSFSSYIFHTSANIPVPATGGSYDGTDEVIPTNWHDDPITPADATEHIWISKARYTQLNGVWSNNGWSAPAQFSGFTPQKGIDYIDGTDGVFTSTIYRNADTIPSVPTGGAFNGTAETTPVNWSDDPESPNPTEFVWASVTRYRKVGLVWSHDGWSQPAKMSGDAGYTPQKGVDYKDGNRGSFTSYVFRNNVPNTPPAAPIGGAYDGVTEIIPANWNDDFTTPDSGNTTYVSKTTYDVDDSGNWTHRGWGAPVQFLGIDGSGADGVSGTSIIWHGDSATIPLEPEDGYAYRNTSTVPAISYVYQDSTWYQMTIDGTNGVNGLSIDYRGEFSTPPASPQLNWAYRDTDNNRVYIWNGSAWALMVADGNDGAPGAGSYTLINIIATTFEDGNTGISQGVGTFWDSAFKTNESFEGAQAVSATSTQSQSTDSKRMWGLCSSTTDSADHTLLDYAIFRDHDDVIKISEFGVEPAGFTDSHTASDSTIMSVVHDGTVIKYKLDGVTIYTSVFAPSGEYHARFIQRTFGVRIQDITYNKHGSKGDTGNQGADGLSVYITYHDNPVTSEPIAPVVGTGQADGWHTNPTSASNWMSQKVSDSVSGGVWGSPISITGRDGEDGSNGTNGDSAKLQFSSDNINWHDTPTSGDKYMRSCTSTAGAAYVCTGSVVIEGTDGARGTIHAYVDGTAWSDVAAATAIANSGGGGVLMMWDIVTISNDAAEFSQTKYWDGDSWEIVSRVYDGALLVNGSVKADSIDIENVFAQVISATGSITGAVVQTATTGRRVVLNDSHSPLTVYNNNNNTVFSTIVDIAGDDQLLFAGRLGTDVIRDATVFSDAGMQALRERLFVVGEFVGGVTYIDTNNSNFIGTHSTTENNSPSGSTLDVTVTGNCRFTEYNVPSVADPTDASRYPDVQVIIQYSINGGSSWTTADTSTHQGGHIQSAHRPEDAADFWQYIASGIDVNQEFTVTGLSGQTAVRIRCIVSLLNGTSALRASYALDGNNTFVYFGGVSPAISTGDNDASFDSIAIATNAMTVGATADMQLGGGSAYNPWLTLYGANGNTERAGISIGESGKHGAASMHMYYTGDGYFHIGMGTMSASTHAAYRAMQFSYQSTAVTFLGSILANQGIVSSGGITASGVVDISGFDDINAKRFYVDSGNNTDGYSLWGSGSAYSMFMSNDTGRPSLVADGDYNTYFYMSGSGSTNTNQRGWVWSNQGRSTTQASAQLTGYGNLHILGFLKSYVATGTAPLQVSSTTKVTNLNCDLLDGYSEAHFARVAKANIFSADQQFTGTLKRSSHSRGCLAGGYNNIGANSLKTSPIYCMGTSYLPGDTTLSNMYGIGYTHSNASFINGTLDNTTGWGMYVAADGDARIYLNASGGHIHLTGNIYANGNITGYYTSDERLKRHITEIDNPLAKVMSWRTSSYEKYNRNTLLWSEEIGFIAQDIEKTTDHVVIENEEGDLTIRQGGNEIAATMAGAIKQLKQEFDGELAKLKAEIAELKGEV